LYSQAKRYIDEGHKGDHSMASLNRFAILVVSLTCILHGQVDRANLNGTVTDTSGAVVPLTKVEVVDRDTGLKRLAETRPTGVYNIPGLPIGTYDLKFSREGAC
jgi:Carboxypeptidase regulatory-like domain